MSRGMMFAAGLVFGIVLGLVVPGFVFEPEISTVFSPEDGDEIIGFIDSADDTIDIEVYVFTSREVVDALERAKARGVEIRIIIERNVVGDDNEEIFRELSSKGFKVRYASKAYKLTHSKFILIDGKAVLVGSHNLSNSAMYKNREASVIIRDMDTVREFMGIFETDWALAY